MDCQALDADPWVSETASDLLGRDVLLRFAVSEFGEVVSCHGVVGQEFDGTTFGQIVFEVGGGVGVRFETMPPAVRVVSIWRPSGFTEESRVVGAVRDYATGLGLNVEWRDPETSWNDGIEIEQYWDPDPGLNGSVSLMRQGGVLVGIRVSMAP